jgi:hypothetical protein
MLSSDGGRDSTGNNEPATGLPQAESGIGFAGGPVKRTYINQSVDDLGEPAESPALAVTNDGVFGYSQAGGEWVALKYGTVQKQLPAVHSVSASVGSSPASRPLISNRNRTVFVDPNNGSDSATGTRDDPFATIQTAVDHCPIYLRHQYRIDLAAVPNLPVAYNEDVLVPAIIATGQAGQEEGAPRAGPVENLFIYGGEDDPRAVEVGSIMFANVTGAAAATLAKATITRNSPYDDEKYGLSAYGSGEVRPYRVRFTGGPTNGVLAYGAQMKASRMDFGSENLAIGIKGKRHASVVAAGVSGQTTDAMYRATANSLIAIREDSNATGNPTWETYRGGLIRDENSKMWMGLDGVGGDFDLHGNRLTNVAGLQFGGSPRARMDERSVLEVEAHSSANDEFQRRFFVNDDGKRAGFEGVTTHLGTFPNHPEQAANGDMWYIDGSGRPSEGFYGQTANGPVLLGGAA